MAAMVTSRGAAKMIELAIGEMADHVRKQLRAQGVMLPSDRATVWQGRSAALTNLRVAGVVTSTEADKIGKRIARAIAKECEPLPCADEDGPMCDDCDCWKQTRANCS